MPVLYDAHCHLEMGGVGNPGGVSGTARGRLLCGVSPADWDAVAAAAGGWPGTVPAFGLHPWHAATPAAGWLDRLEELLAAHPGAWLGEAGLDGFRADAPPADIQEEAFRLQLRLAAKHGRPVNLHCVKAWEALPPILDAEYLAGEPRDFIVHSFGGPHQAIGPLVERGAYFTVGPLSARPESRRQRRRAAALPEDRLLVESDANLQPGRDAVGDLLAVIAWLAESRQCDADALAGRIADNSRRLFNHDH